MWMIRTLSCFRRGHAFRAFVYRGSVYSYCLRCGKVKSPEHSETVTIELGKQIIRLSLPVLILLTPIITVACAQSVPQELTTNEQLWKNQGLKDYSFTLQRQAFAPEDWRGPVNIQVRNGTPVSLTYTSSGAAVTGGKFDNADTIEELFSMLKDAYTGKGEFKQFRQKADTINVTYDTKMGYPASFYIDVSQKIADEESGYTVTNLVAETSAK